MKIKNLHMLSNNLNYSKDSLMFAKPKNAPASSAIQKLPTKKAKKAQSKNIANKASKNKKPTTIIPGPIEQESKIKLDSIISSGEQQQGKSEADQGKQQNEEPVYFDYYRVKCSGLKCTDLISYIQLPKFIFAPSMKKQTSTQGMKGLLAIEVVGGIDPKGKVNAYTDLLKASRDGIKDFAIDLLSEEEQVLLTIELIKPRINAIDFGDFSVEREEVRSIKVEIDYDYLKFNDETF